MTNQNLNPSSKNRQYLLKMNGEVIDNVHYFTMLNKANLNRFDDWSDREYYSNNICLVSPIMSVNGIGYGCTCRRYLYEYVCEHSLAASIQTNSIPDDIKLDLPLRNQRRKKLGCPVKAVKGPYRLQPVELSNNQQRIETDGVNEMCEEIILDIDAMPNVYNAQDQKAFLFADNFKSSEDDSTINKYQGNYHLFQTSFGYLEYCYSIDNSLASIIIV